VQRRLPGTRLHEVRLPRGVAVTEAIRRFEGQPDVQYAEPDFVLAASGAPVEPDDPELGRLYGLNNTGQNGGTPDADIDAPEAWSTTVGSASTVVAVIDTGTDIRHPDLRDNIWTNPGEVADNAIDDDGNGYVDDVHGWDFANDDNTVFDGVGDEHGTHVSGTIAATGGNGVGVTGVAWRAQLMPLKFLSDTGGYTSDAIAALDYAVANGAQISNNSWGGAPASRSLRDAIAAAGARGHLFVAAAGNGGSDGVGDDIDDAPHYPAAYPEDNIVSVAATNRTDTLAAFSNYGNLTVDLAAPGVGIFSTLPNDTYGSYSGTSMAAPHVSGAAALLLSNDPTLTGVGLKELLLSSVDRLGGLEGVVGSGGRLNIATALVDVSQPVIDLAVSAPIVAFGSAAVVAGQVTVARRPAADVRVLVEHRRVGTSAWTPVPGADSLVTTAEGTYRLANVVPTASTDYRARLASGDPVTSPVVRIDVRPLVVNRTATTDLALGRQRLLRGAVGPAHGGSVILTVLRNGIRVLRTTVPLVESRYQHSYKPGRRGAYTVFATWRNDGDHLGASSARRSFRVT